MPVSTAVGGLTFGAEPSDKFYFVEFGGLGTATASLHRNCNGGQTTTVTSVLIEDKPVERSEFELNTYNSSATF